MSDKEDRIKSEIILINEAFNAGSDGSFANSEEWPCRSHAVSDDTVETMIYGCAVNVGRSDNVEDIRLSRRELFEQRYGEGCMQDEREMLFQCDDKGYKLMQCREAYKWFCEGLEAAAEIKED